MKIPQAGTLCFYFNTILNATCYSSATPDVFKMIYILRCEKLGVDAVLSQLLIMIHTSTRKLQLFRKFLRINVFCKIALLMNKLLIFQYDKQPLHFQS